MKNRGRIIPGAILTIVGVLLLLGRLLNVDLGAFCVPVGLIAIGALILARPYVVSPDTDLTFRPFADIRRRGDWRVRDEEIWIFVGDVDLDLTTTEIPSGNARIRLYGFVSDVDVTVPEGMAVGVTSNAFITDAKTPEGKQDHIASTARWTSEEYDTAENRLDIDLVMFIADLSIHRV